MSVNKELPHIFVLPEDDANVQLANEFHKQVDWNRLRRMQVLPAAGGWRKVLSLFESVHAAEMDRYDYRFMVLLMDFDGDEDRLQEARGAIPQHLTDRTFVVGALGEPEDLRRAHLGSYEDIGTALVQDCRDGTDTTWGHPLLRHKAAEVGGLGEHVRRILFSSI